MPGRTHRHYAYYLIGGLGGGVGLFMACRLVVKRQEPYLLAVRYLGAAIHVVYLCEAFHGV